MEFASYVIKEVPACTIGAGRPAFTAAEGQYESNRGRETRSAVVTVMPVMIAMPVMMAAHFGIGVQHAWLDLHEFGGRGGMACAPGGAGHRGRGQNRNREQCC